MNALPPEQLAALLDLRSIEAERRRRHAEARLSRYVAHRDRGDPERGMAGPKHLALHRSQVTGRVLKGGNRSGKTVWGAVEAIWWLTGTHPFRQTPPPPVKLRCVTPELPGTMDKEHVARDTVRAWMPERWLRGGTWSAAYSIVGHTLHLANGSYIEFLSSEQDLDKHAGAGLHAVWFDEECPRLVWQENVMRLASGEAAGDWWMTYTPVLGLAWIEEDVYQPALRGERPDIAVQEVTTYDNRHNLAPGAIEQLEAQFPDPRDRDVRLHGRYGRREGLVYAMFGLEHTADVIIG